MKAPDILEKLNISDMRWIYRNIIAKIGLANDEYLITSIAEEHIKANNFTKGNVLTRGKKCIKNGFTYEHPIPACVTLQRIKENIGNENKIRELLQQSDNVTLLTKEENDMLNAKGLKSKMPDDWDGNDIFARYKESGIEVPTKFITMTGAISR